MFALSTELNGVDCGSRTNSRFVHRLLDLAAHFGMGNAVEETFVVGDIRDG